MQFYQTSLNIPDARNAPPKRGRTGGRGVGYISLYQLGGPVSSRLNNFRYFMVHGKSADLIAFDDAYRIVLEQRRRRVGSWRRLLLRSLPSPLRPRLIRGRRWVVKLVVYQMLSRARGPGIAPALLFLHSSTRRPVLRRQPSSSPTFSTFIYYIIPPDLPAPFARSAGYTGVYRV